MRNITFFPGPSRVFSNVPEYFYEAYMSGILSVNHRSETFMQLMKETVDLMHSKLKVPQDYLIAFTSSATESWEIIAQSLTTKSSHHFFNGSFGEKWFQYAQQIHPSSVKYPFDLSSTPDPNNLISTDVEVICLTHNETSNGTRVDDSIIKNFKLNQPNAIIAADATSSMGGVYIDFSVADVWFASIQKCFGLPAGLGILILSPKAIAKSEEIGENKHYNSLNTIIGHAKNFQTSYTPNVLAIYFLKRVLQMSRPIDELSAKIKDRQFEWLSFFNSIGSISPLSHNTENLSWTVLALQSHDLPLEHIKKLSHDSGIFLGNGYGTWKNNSFRIANFPAIKSKEIAQAKDLFSKIFSNR